MISFLFFFLSFIRLDPPPPNELIEAPLIPVKSSKVHYSHAGSRSRESPQPRPLDRYALWNHSVPSGSPRRQAAAATAAAAIGPPVSRTAHRTPKDEAAFHPHRHLSAGLCASRAASEISRPGPAEDARQAIVETAVTESAKLTVAATATAEYTLKSTPQPLQPLPPLTSDTPPSTTAGRRPRQSRSVAAYSAGPWQVPCILHWPFAVVSQGSTPKRRHFCYTCRDPNR